MKSLNDNRGVWRDIYRAVQQAEALSDIGQSVNQMFLNALCHAAEHESREFLLEVVKIVRNRQAGGSLSTENGQVVQWMERFRVGSLPPSSRPDGTLQVTSENQGQN